MKTSECSIRLLKYYLDLLAIKIGEYKKKNYNRQYKAL